MAKVTMYRGATVISSEGFIAVCGDKIAMAAGIHDSPWSKPETFGEFTEWESWDTDDEDREYIKNAEKIWEADL